MVPGVNSMANYYLNTQTFEVKPLQQISEPDRLHNQVNIKQPITPKMMNIKEGPG